MENLITIIRFYFEIFIKKFESYQSKLLFKSTRDTFDPIATGQAPASPSPASFFYFFAKFGSRPSLGSFVTSIHSDNDPLIGISWRSVAKSGPPKKPMLPYQRIFRSLLCLS